jgi:hypothetical protein
LEEAEARMKAERDKAADMGGLRLVPKSVRQAAEQLVDGSGGSKVCWGDVWSVKCGAASSHVRTHCIGVQGKSHWTRNNTRTSGFFYTFCCAHGAAFLY